MSKYFIFVNDTCFTLVTKFLFFKKKILLNIKKCKLEHIK